MTTACAKRVQPKAGAGLLDRKSFALPEHEAPASKAFYFDRFEKRLPPTPQAPNRIREACYRTLVIATILFGARYLHWRWFDSTNFDALWFSLPLVLAESLAFVGSVLLFATTWTLKDSPSEKPPQWISQCSDDFATPPVDRAISVDIFITTYDEDVELVAKSVRAAKAVHVPEGVDCQVYVLDDGVRSALERMASREQVRYIRRHSSKGYKAGNLRHALLRTNGDFVVICDADTRLFPEFLESTLGYFRDPLVSWVQTPQWFFDVPSGRLLSEVARSRLGSVAGNLAASLEKLIGPVRIAKDPLSNDAMPFYDVILRRRNAQNAAFCCGAASIHRREAVMRSAVRRYAQSIRRKLRAFDADASHVSRPARAKQSSTARAFADATFMPYQFHVSEDIYTSLLQHADHKRWRSVYHPYVLSKMLSPQDLHTWLTQQFKYAGGTLHLALAANPLTLRGLTLRQRLAYMATVWSYLAGTWNLILLLAPIVYLTTAASPVISYSQAFVWHIAPFLILNQLAMMVLFWGVPVSRSAANHLANFSLSLRALWTVLRKRKIRFQVTPKTGSLRSGWHLAWPHLLIASASILAATLALIQTATCTGIAAHYSFGGLVVNVFWALFNVGMLSGRIRAARYRPQDAAAAERVSSLVNSAKESDLVKEAARYHLLIVLGLVLVAWATLAAGTGWACLGAVPSQTPVSTFNG